MTMNVTRYTAEDQPIWDEFVKKSKNATFLFERNFMDYHSNRFSDHSLFIYNDSKLVALLPACEFNADTAEASIVSHGGLSYGGVLSDTKMGASTMLEVFEAILEYYKSLNFKSLKYKAIPHIYHTSPAEEDLYSLFRFNAELIQVDNSTTVDQLNRIAYSKSKKHGVRDAKKHDLTLSHEQSGDNLEQFFELLGEVLQDRHDTTPTHTIDEMKFLQSRFPKNIKVHSVFESNQMVAGALMFLTPKVAHTQYLATSERGRDTSALDLVLDHLINDAYTHIPYFNFGISNENGGKVLNEGLCRQKEMFGGRSTAQLTYQIKL